MAFNPQRFYGPAQIPGVNTLLATVPDAHRWLVREMVICNTSASQATLTIGYAADAGLTAGTRFFHNVIIAPAETKIVCMRFVMVAKEVIRASASIPSALTVSIHGLDIT